MRRRDRDPVDEDSERPAPEDSGEAAVDYGPHEHPPRSEHRDQYTRPYDQWSPDEYVFYQGQGYHRGFYDPFLGSDSADREKARKQREEKRRPREERAAPVHESGEPDRPAVHPGEGDKRPSPDVQVRGSDSHSGSGFLTEGGSRPSRRGATPPRKAR